MPDGYSDFINVPSARPAGKIPTTTVTNELRDALARFGISESAAGGISRVPVVCKATGNESAHGKYTAKAYLTTGYLCDPTQAINSTNIEKQKILDNCVLVNLQEVDGTGWWLTNAANTSQKYFAATLYGFTRESTPRAVFVCNAIYVKAC